MARSIALWALVAACVPARRLQAHRLDEYLQAALISLELERVEIELNLTPGVAVFGQVLAQIDRDGDGVISSAEQQIYANRVLGDLSVAVDRHAQVLELTSARFPPMEEMRAGLGTIRLVLQANFDGIRPGPHELRFENHHRTEIGVFLANALAPPKSISIARQSRDERQTEICIDYWVGEAAIKPAKVNRLLAPAAVCIAALLALCLVGSAFQGCRRASARRPYPNDRN